MRKSQRMWDGSKPENRGSGSRGREEGQERVARSRREEVKLHGLTEAESAEVDFTLALVTAGDTEDEQG